ncbi:MAG: DNA polymerase I [Dongiaceae bacterium]
MTASGRPERLYLIDGSGYIFRAFHALPPLTREDGTPVNAVLGFANMIWKLLGETGDADAVAVIFDAGRKSFRNELYQDYKAHRPEAPPELVPQFPLIREATHAFNLPCIELAGFEADDLIASYAKAATEAGAEVVVVSSDKDLMQLIGDRVAMLDPIKNRRIGVPEVIEKFGVTPDKMVDVQALIGDSTDNVPGVPGIGVKTAAELINAFGDLDSLLARSGEIKQPKRRETLQQNADKARLSRDLVRLRADVPLPEPLDALRVRPADPEKLLAFCRANQFRALVTRVEARSAGRPPVLESDVPAPPPAPPPPAPEAAPRDYALLDEEAALARWIAAAEQAGTFALQLVPAGEVEAMRAGLLGLALAIEPGRVVYVPLGHRVPAAQGDLMGGDLVDAAAAPPRQLPAELVLARLKPLLEDEAVLKIGFDIKRDMLMLGRRGIALRAVDDAMLMSYVLEGGVHGHSMAELHELHLGRPPVKLAEIAGSGRNRLDPAELAPSRLLDYACQQADLAVRLARLLKPRLRSERLLTVYQTIERPLVAPVAAMEQAGIAVDREELRRLSQDFAQRIGEFELAIYKLAGREFNIGSPKQLGEVLFDELNLGAGKKGKTGAYATGHEVLEELAALGHDLPARVLDWRQLSKLKSTYTDALVEEINPATGRVHTSFELAVASTGRLSSTAPNLQNIPIRTEEGRKIRRAFVAAPGHKLLSVDYSQIELRLAAHIAEIAPLRQAFAEGIDIHALTASQVFGLPVEGMDPMVRRRAKAINFGIIYGISPFGLAQQLGIPQAEAKAYIEAYLARFPGIRSYMERTRELARRQGYVTTLFGRRCHVPGINDRNPARRSFMERAAINAPLQGSAADIIKRAMIRIPPALASAGLRGRMLLQVHDELLFEVPEAELDATSALVRRIMEQAPLPAVQLSVPLVAESGVGDNWAAAH